MMGAPCTAVRFLSSRDGSRMKRLAATRAAGMARSGVARSPQAAKKRAKSAGPAANPRLPPALKIAMPTSGWLPLSVGVTEAPFGWKAAEPRHPRKSSARKSG